MNSQKHNLSIDMRGDEVKRLHEKLVRLGFDLAENERAEAFFGPTTYDIVLKLQVQAGFEPTGVVDPQTASLIDRMVDGLRPPFTVKGRVISAEGRPVAGVKVCAYDRDLRGKASLGETITDHEGYYEIGYWEHQFCRAEKGSADLYLRVYRADGDCEMATSAIYFNADPLATIDLSLGQEAYRDPAEYEQLIRELTPLLQGLSLAELVEDEQHQDVTFLSGETGQARERITFLITAHQLAEKTGLPAELFYGFFRQNLPTDLPALLAQGAEGQRRALEAAMRENIISPDLQGELESILQRLNALQVEQPLFLTQPEVLFGKLADFDHLTEEQAGFIAARLNEHLRREIVEIISPAGEAMIRAVHAAVARLDYQKFKEADLPVVIKAHVLAELKKQASLAAAVAEIEARLADMSPAKVSEILHLDQPLKENPLFAADLSRVKTVAYARLAGLTPQIAQKLVEKNLPLDGVDEPILAELVKEKLLSEAEKTELQLTLDLGKLTGDNLALVGALKSGDLSSVADFIGWEKADWQHLLVDEAVPLPPGETAETYADTILFNIEQTYPSQFLLSRLLAPAQTSRFERLDSLDSLLRHNERLIGHENPAAMDWRGISPARREQLAQALQELTAFAHTYRHLGVAELINDKTLGLEQKKAAIAARLSLLDTFFRGNPGLDLRLVNFFDAHDESLNWSNILPENRARVRKQLMAYQRSLSLADDTADRQTLLSHGYDAAMTIAGLTEAEFMSATGLTQGKARMLYTRAQEAAVEVAHNFEAIRDAVAGQYKDLAVANQAQRLVNDLREIDGFDALFGPQHFCDCGECHSILSPAAYFVDLMSFIDQNISRPVFVNVGQDGHPLYLKKRRKDLWQLKLTCENTHTLIPYLTIVNEVLQKYLEETLGKPIFEKMSDSNENISFGLPFNLPLEETRVYLGHFGLTLHDVYRLLKQPEDKVWRAKLNLSPEEFEDITTPKPTEVRFRFGDVASWANFPVHDYKDKANGVDRRGFIQLAGLTRQQLDELLGLQCNPDLRQIIVEKGDAPDEPELPRNPSRTSKMTG